MLVVTDLESRGLLGLYGDLASMSEEMAAAAAMGDWGRLHELKGKCSQKLRLVPSLKSMEGRPDRSYIKMKFHYLSIILENDRRIRDSQSKWSPTVEDLLYSRTIN